MHQARARTLAGVLGIALAVVAGAVGLGWWSGQAHLAQAIAETKAALPAIAAWAQDFDTPEKRQRALWVLSADGKQSYHLAQLNNGFKRWLACEFGQGVGYTQQEGSYTICYPASPKAIRWPAWPLPNATPRQRRNKWWVKRIDLATPWGCTRTGMPQSLLPVAAKLGTVTPAVGRSALHWPGMAPSRIRPATLGAGAGTLPRPTTTRSGSAWGA